MGPGDLKALTFGVEGLGFRVSGRAGIMKMRVLRRPGDYVGAQFLKERPNVCRKLTNRCQGKRPLQKRSELNPNSTKSVKMEWRGPLGICGIPANSSPES